MQKNGGKYVAHNKGVKLTKTDYFCCVDSDDYLDKNAISCLVAGLDKGKNDTVIGGFTKVTDTGKKLYVEKYSSQIFAEKDKINKHKAKRLDILLKTMIWEYWIILFFLVQ